MSRIGWREADGLPTAPGAYALLIEVPRPFELPIRRLAERGLAAGRTLYGGAANGPGGIRARVRRHLRHDKAIRWHVDRLTAVGRVVAVHAAPGGSECALFEQVMKTPGASVPAPGFGGSDCRRCPAHLAAVSADTRGESMLYISSIKLVTGLITTDS